MGGRGELARPAFHLGRVIGVLTVFLAAAPVGAHSFGRAYTLPVPVWMYLYGAAGAPVASFVIIGYFVNRSKVWVELLTLDLSRPLGQS